MLSQEEFTKIPGVAQTVLNRLEEERKQVAKQKRRWWFRDKPQKDQTKQNPVNEKKTKQSSRAKQINMDKVNQGINGQHVEFSSLAKLEYGLQWCENLIHILAPRLLIVGFVISMVDLLTRGSLLNNGIMVYAWAIIQAMAIDATLPNMWRLAFLRYDEGRWVAGSVLLIVAVALAGVVLAALSIQFLQQSTGMDLNKTMTSLGIDPSILSYVRSVAVVALAAILSVLNRTKITRAKPSRVNSSTQPQETSKPNEDNTKQERNTDEHEALNIKPTTKKLHAVHLVNNDSGSGDKLTTIKHLLVNTDLGTTEIAKQTGVSKGYVSQVKARLNTIPV